MRVEALLYPPTSTGFRLDYSRLNKVKLDASAEETSFRLNYHRLDDWINGTYPWDVGIRLGGLPPVRTLQDVAGRTLIGVKWHRGFSRDGLGFSGAVGLMELTFKDGGDPDQYPGLAAGTPVVLWTEDDGESVFQGRFESAEMHPRKDGGFDCVWLIADPVRALTRTKVGPFPEQSWDERAWAIGALPSYNGDLGFSGRIAATNLVATKAEHLDMLAQSTMGAWYVGASFDAEAGVGNQQPFFDVPYREADGLPPRVLSDVSPTSYTEVTAGWGSGTVNDLTLANAQTHHLEDRSGICSVNRHLALEAPRQPGKHRRRSSMESCRVSNARLPCDDIHRPALVNDATGCGPGNPALAKAQSRTSRCLSDLVERVTELSANCRCDGALNERRIDQGDHVRIIGELNN